MSRRHNENARPEAARFRMQNRGAQTAIGAVSGS